MTSFATAEKERQELYRIFIGAIVPRPIAFVATRGPDGVTNLAPFSFFNGVCSNPPTLAFSVGDRGTEMKDTSRNIKASGEFIVHIVSEQLGERMNVTSGEYGAHVDELAEAGLTAVPGSAVNVSRVAEAPVAFECRLTHFLRIGETPPMTSHILGEIVYWHVDEAILDEKGRVKAETLQAIGRMGGMDYTKTAQRFTMNRPVIAPEDPRSIPAHQAALAKPMPK